MLSKIKRSIVRNTRRSLHWIAERSVVGRRMMELSSWELRRALDRDFYDGAYFGEGRDPLDRMGLSGYEVYTRDTAHANEAAYFLWKYFPAENSLDVGCATGFIVEALRELEIDAKGMDYSQYAVDHAARGAQGHLRSGDLLKKLPFRRETFDLTTCFETLEHLPPDQISNALSELRRVTKHWLVCTMPSFGFNRFGPHGWFRNKVPDDKIAYYRDLGPDFEGPIPYEDLARDSNGKPVEGHLTIASFGWWIKQFQQAGFIYEGEMVHQINQDLCRFHMLGYWNVYVFRTPDTPAHDSAVRNDEDINQREKLWGLDELQATQKDLDLLNAEFGELTMDHA